MVAPFNLAAAPIDVAVLAGYLVLSFAVGLLASRWLRPATDANQNEEAYYLAGRKVPGWVNGVSYAVTAINADVAPMYCGLAVVVGLPIAWYYLSRFAFAWAIVAILFAVRWRQLGVRTGPEFYTLRFGGKGARFIRIYTALFAIAVNMIPWLGAGLLGTHKILAPVFEFEAKLVTLACIVPLLLTYVWVSGFAGVLVTDVLQSAVILASSLILLGIVLAEAGGPSGLAEAIRAAHPVEHVEILSITPVPGHAILSPLVVMLWFVVPTIGRGGNVDLDGQRILSCRSSREAAQAPLWAAAALFAMLLLLTLPVLGLLAQQPQLYHASAEVREQAYGMLLDRYLPPGILGLALAALLASVMSTIDSHLNFGAQTLVHDVLRPLFPGARWLQPEHRATVWVGRLAMVGILACGIGVMFAADSLFRIATIVAGMFASSAAFFWAQWWWWRINLPSWIAAMIGGPIVYFSLGAWLPASQWWQSQLELGPAQVDVMAMLQALVAMALTTILWLGVALLTRPETEQTLEAFYLRARPPGAWGPIRNRLHQTGRLPAYVAPPGVLLGGMGTAAVAACLLTLVVVACSQAAVGAYGVAAVLGASALATGAVLRRMFDWHLARMGVSANSISEHDS
jgi:solute:Na+ symporter, SSS family